MNGAMDDLSGWWQKLRAESRDQQQAVHDAYQRLENAGLISKVTVHRYNCRRCGPRATVIRVAGQTIARTRDNKFSPGLNEQRSTESARARRTLDGGRHWPGQTHDVDDLADDGGDDVGFDVNCRHVTATIIAREVLALTRDVTPGRPGKPTLL